MSSRSRHPPITRGVSVPSKLPEAMEAGVKLKMPVGLLGHATRAQKTLEDLRKTGGVEGVVIEAIKKFEQEVIKLREACALVEPVDEGQKVAKGQWVERNLVPKERFLLAMRSVLDEATAQPQLQVNGLEVDGDPADQASLMSVPSSRASRASGASSASRLARAEAAAKTRMLEVEKEHRQRRWALEEQERQLQRQREADELDNQLQQARILQEALEEAGSHTPSVAGPQPQVSDGFRQHLGVGNVRQASPRTYGQSQGFDVSNATDGLLQHVLLPPSKLPMFKGDHLEFLWFLKAFEMRVEAVTSDPNRRLHLLIQHLEGDARTLVMGCQLAQDPAVGYARAKEKLVHKYGNPVRQALAFKSKLLSWPNVKKDSPTELERFSVQLQLCEELKLAGGLAELDASGTLLHLMLKLPQKMQETWQVKACRIEATQFREANFHDFSQFVTELAAARNHPVFGRGGHTNNSDTSKTAKALLTGVEESAKTNPTTTTVIASQSTTTTSVASSPPDPPKNPCALCSGSHSTAKCRKSAAMPLEERKTKLKGLCFACLKPGHTARQCTSKLTCDRCKGVHPTVLHEEAESNVSVEEKRSDPDKSKGETACVVASSSVVAVAMVPVRVWCAQRANSVVVKAILDPGSTASFISQKLVDMLGLRTRETSLRLTTLTEEGAAVPTHVVAGLKVTGMDQNGTIALPPVYTMPKMPFEGTDQVKEEDVRSWAHLDGVPFDWKPEASVEMLIGVNTPTALRPLEVLSGGPEEPYAVRTALGWCVNGPVKRPMRSGSVVSNFVAAEEVQKELSALYYREFNDAFDFRSKGLSQEDKEWLGQVEASIKRDTKTGQFEIALPFRTLCPPLEDNREQAMKRLLSLKRKLATNSQFRDDYAAFMLKMEMSGFVEEVAEAEVTEATPWASYIPHHGVYHPRKPGKIRVVFNCSNKFHDTSLNDRLLQGPDLTTSLVGVLLRFRQEHIAFMADIESMFYRVRVPSEQRDCLRYLWWPGGALDKPVKTFRMAVHVFGATSSPSCANFALRRAARGAREAGEVTHEVQDAVDKNFYVDDCLKSTPDVGSAISMAQGLIKACAYGGFRLTKFVSSSVEVLRALPSRELSKNLSHVDLSDDKNDPLGSLAERALGVAWDAAHDMFKLTVLMTPKAKTKRGVLSTLSAVYDPIGIAAPVLIVARVFFRELTREKELGWDEEVTGAQGWRTWTEWLSTLHCLEDITIPRCFRPKQEAGSSKRPWQLHVFCDASEDAYAAVAYLRQKHEGGADELAHVAFVTGKARVAPPKVVTIPRLELVAAKLATDVALTVERELEYDLEKRIFWSDSQTVLKYLSNRVRRFHTFVANRVATILEVSKVEEWRYVPSELNPADEGSRGCMPKDFKSSRWVPGPNFLQQDEESWPRSMGQLDITDDDPEVHTLAVQLDETRPFIEELGARYSSSAKFRSAVAVWISFLDYMQGKATQLDPQRAERLAIRGVQRHYFEKEIEALKRGNPILGSSPLKKLSPALDEDGVVVMESRIRARLPILPGGSVVAALLVQEAHLRCAHFGRQATAAEACRRVWIIGVNRLAKRVARNCPTCQRCFSSPVQPRMSTLPEFRVGATHAFECTGVDYFGPFYVSRARSQVKMWGVIFTCATTRAVHLEVAEDLSSSTFINALRRFVARRGHVRRMVSDNGTNFVGANNELQQEIARLRSSTTPVKWLQDRNIEWSFNPPEASHHGGFWERLIRSVRHAFEALFQRGRSMTQDSLTTLMCEIEAVLNNRPLTPISDDPRDFEALTPNHLLLSKEGPAPPPGDFDSSIYPLRQQWKVVQSAANYFWQRWSTEYRTLLHRRFKWCADRPSLRVEDVVLVMDQQQPREFWPLGRVVQTHPGEDGRVRVVTVRTAKGCFKKSVSRLCWLEATSEAWLAARKQQGHEAGSCRGEDVKDIEAV